MTAIGLGVLSDLELASARACGELGVEPFDPATLRPAALSLHLGREAWILVPHSDVDVGDDDSHPTLERREPDSGGRLRLDPGEVMLAPTEERVSLSPMMVGLLDGTSDYARLGISVVLSHQVSPGFGSDNPGGAVLTLEIVSRLSRTVYLRPGTRIANLMLMRCGQAERPYPQMAANYSRDESVRASRLAEHHAR